MTNDPDVEAGTIWRSQPIEPVIPSEREVTERARKYGRTKQRESIVGVLLALFTIGACFFIVITGRTSVPRGMALLAALAVLVALWWEVYSWHKRRVWPRWSAETDAVSAPCLTLYRSGLEQRRALSTPWDVYVASAGLVALVSKPLPGVPWYAYVLIGLCLAALFAVRRREAQRARQELQALDEFEKPD